MDYLLFEKGKVLPTDPTVQEAYSFFYPLDLYWGSFKLRQELASGFGSPVESGNLKNIFDQTRQAPHPHLGIGVKSTYVKNDGGGSEEKIAIEFFPVQHSPFQIHEDKYDLVYVLSNSTCDNIYHQNGNHHLTRYQYARYPDRRLVIYLFADHEVHNPVRIPSE